ncbi:RNA-directed DNA polymerase [Burkholderia cepacia]|uniref:RNA-directed DNA polymerase n=1 Tax=Burkholderia cepacia TaxID=292 RepID=UPI001F329D74|nr:RNA-directed DNA polymerase [Burkholderia cepacia]MCE4129644.1 RNA-directed DNA polymerase [Burkholderia cepacia]
MALNISDASLDWALLNAENYGDTDIFPGVFEFAAIRHDWDAVKTTIRNTDVLAWTIRASRTSFAPKHQYGFRLSTQLDPFDFLVFTALVHEIGAQLEARRIPTNDGNVHSYRFKPGADGRMFDDALSYRSFQQASQDRCNVFQPSHVLIADVADFFPRLYLHRVDNALESALGTGHMHAIALKKLINHWAGSYSYGLPVGSAASRLIAEITISDIDQLLLSEGANYVRYSDDFRVFCSSEAEAYKFLTYLARWLFDNHGLTLQQHKTRIVSTEVFRQQYLRENENRELDTLSERFHELLSELGIDDAYGEIDYESLDDSHKESVDQLNLEGILEEQIAETEPDLSLVKFALRRLRQLKDADAVPIILDNFSKFVPVVRETIDYLLGLDDLPASKKSEIGSRLIAIYRDPAATASHLEYARMYTLMPFGKDPDWNSEKEYIPLFNDAIDDFSAREILLAMGRSKQDFWFRSKKQSYQQMSPWLRRAFLYGASCLPADEYKHWVRGIDAQLDDLEKAVVKWARRFPIGT